MHGVSEKAPALAVLLAAGRGSRLMPATRTVPKPLLHYNGCPIIYYALDATLHAGIPRVIIIVHHLRDRIVAAISDEYAGRCDLEFCVQPELDGTAGAVAAIAPLIQQELSTKRHLLITATDYAYPISHIEELCVFHLRHSAEISISLREVPLEEKDERSQVEWTESTGLITRITEKPGAVEVDDSPVASLLYICPAEIVTRAQAVALSQRGEFELPDVVNAMIEGGLTARGLVQGYFPDL